MILLMLFELVQVKEVKEVQIYQCFHWMNNTSLHIYVFYKFRNMTSSIYFYICHVVKNLLSVTQNMKLKQKSFAVCFIGCQIYGNVSQIYVLFLTKVEFHASLYVHIMVSVIFVRKFPLQLNSASGKCSIYKHK